MSTRAAIARWNEDGTITAIYCHNDGYPQYTGKLLVTNYDTERKAKALIKLGSISQLRPKLAPAKGTQHTFDAPQKDVTIAYHRDRGEELEYNYFHDLEHYMKDAPKVFDAEYLYLFSDGDWYCKDVRNNRIYKAIRKEKTAA